MKKARDKYFGEVAANYDACRTKKAHWAKEQDVVRAWLHTLPKGASIGDVPFGTGRFARFYAERGLDVRGADISPDMLNAAREKLGDIYPLDVAPADALPWPDKSVDYLISHRFVKWLPNEKELVKVLKEFARVTRKEMLIQVKLAKNKKRSLRDRVMRKWRLWRSGRIKTLQITDGGFTEAVRKSGLAMKSVSRHPEIGKRITYYVLHHEN